MTYLCLITLSTSSIPKSRFSCLAAHIENLFFATEVSRALLSCSHKAWATLSGVSGFFLLTLMPDKNSGLSGVRKSERLICSCKFFLNEPNAPYEHSLSILPHENNAMFR